MVNHIIAITVDVSSSGYPVQDTSCSKIQQFVHVYLKRLLAVSVISEYNFESKYYYLKKSSNDENDININLKCKYKYVYEYKCVLLFGDIHMKDLGY